jgi:pyruvate dehydrogenase E1 component alpha subunit
MAPKANKASAGKSQASFGNVPKTPAPADFTKEQELNAYREMLLIRRFEEKAGQLYGMGFIGGFCHLYIGQEAVVVGMQSALKVIRSSLPIVTMDTCWQPAWKRVALWPS